MTSVLFVEVHTIQRDKTTYFCICVRWTKTRDLPHSPLPGRSGGVYCHLFRRRRIPRQLSLNTVVQGLANLGR